MRASASTRRACSRKPCRTGSSRMAARSVRAERSARAQKGVAGFSFGNANIWARGADQFGSATASAASAGVGYDINRAAPLIAGVDWRLDNGIVAGVAATYVATSAKFKDGSSTNVSSYQGARLRRLGRRAVVRLGKRGRELQRVRHLAPAHALRASRRRDLLAFRPKLSGPCGGGLSLGRSGRGRERLRHALRGARLRERASSRLQRDGRLRRAFGERDGRELLPDDARRSPHLAHRDRRLPARSFPSFASAGTTNSSTPRKRSRRRSSAFREAPSPRPASPSAATPRSWAQASAWSFRPTPRCSSITTAGSAHACRSTRSRAGCACGFRDERRSFPRKAGI